MTPPLPKSESLQSSPHWDEYLLARLEEFESALHRGSVPPLSNPGDLSDCPPEIADELRRLQSLLLWVENVVPPSNVHSGANVKSTGSTTTPNSEPQTLPLPSASPRSSPDQSWSDLRMGRFELGLKLGEGTYGIVYLAQDPRLKRLVALKIPRLDAAFREDLRERFIREGESAARLNHPNIVTVFEAVSEGPVSFIASEYIPGPNLATWLAEHSSLPIPPREAARLIADLAAGVAHAHAKHVLHRDIKPSNILLAPRTDNPNSLGDYQPKLTDFGLAKLLETQDATLSGAIVGTPAYMPPEQIAGETAQIGPAVDIYALGMVLYQLLTGSNPFLKPSVGETIHAVTSANLPAPSGIHRAVPRDLETICLKCLRRDRHERYATAADLATDLERYLTNRPIRARNVSPLERAIKWTHRYPALTTSTLAAFGLLFALLVISNRKNQEVVDALETSKQNEQIANERLLTISHRNYLNEMRLVGNAWNAGNGKSALEILEEQKPEPGQPDFRDFAWWAVWNQYHDNSRVIGTHEGEANAVVCTSMAPYAAFTGGKDAVIKIWSIPDGRLIGELKGHTLGPIQSLELNPVDESTLLSAAEDGTVRIWDLQTRTEKMVFRDHEGWVATAKYSPNGSLVASAGADKVVRVWDSATGEQLQGIKGHRDTIRGLAFFPAQDWEWILSSAQDGTVRCSKSYLGIPWDVGGKYPRGIILQGNSGWGQAMEFTEDRKSVFVGSVGMWNVELLDPKQQLTSFVGGPRTRSVERLLDGRLLMGMGDSSIRVAKKNWRECNEDFWILNGHLVPEVFGVAPLPNDRGFISVGKNGEVRLWNPSTLLADLNLDRSISEELRWMKWKQGRLDHLHFDNGQFHVGASDDRTAKLLWTLPIYGSDVRENISSGTHPARDRAWVLVRDELTAYRIPEMKILWLKDLGLKSVTGTATIDFDATGKFACIAKDRSLLILSGETGEILVRTERMGCVSSVRFLEHHPYLAVRSDDGKLGLWDLNSISDRPVLEHQLDPVGLGHMAFSPEERWISAHTAQRRTKVWSFPEMKLICDIPDPDSKTIGKVFVVDEGKTLMRVQEHREQISFWNISEDLESLTLNLGESGDVDLSPDGKSIAITTSQGIRIIDGRPRP